MRRSIAIALTTVAALALGRPAWAADDRADAAQNVRASADARLAVSPLAGDVDWSLPAIEVRPATRPGPLSALYVSFAALQAFDAFSTLHGLGRGAAESNPVIAGVVGNPAAMWAVKGGVSAASILVAERLWRQHRRSASIATMVVANGVMAAVAARNAAVLGAQR
jgi:uncharacterized protein DUF5658